MKQKSYTTISQQYIYRPYYQKKKKLYQAVNY